MATTGWGGFVNNTLCNFGVGNAFGVGCGPNTVVGVGSQATGQSTPGLTGALSNIEAYISQGASQAASLGFRVGFGTIGVIVIAIGLAAIVFSERGAGGASPAGA